MIKQFIIFLLFALALVYLAIVLPALFVVTLVILIVGAFVSAVLRLGSI